MKPFMEEAIEHIQKLEEKIWKYESVLRTIATPKRPDGTYNYCREACQTLAERVLDEE
jgi:hypothetical protein